MNNLCYDYVITIVDNSFYKKPIVVNCFINSHSNTLLVLKKIIDVYSIDKMVANCIESKCKQLTTIRITYNDLFIMVQNCQNYLKYQINDEKSYPVEWCLFDNYAIPLSNKPMAILLQSISPNITIITPLYPDGMIIEEYYQLLEDKHDILSNISNIINK